MTDLAEVMAKAVEGDGGLDDTAVERVAKWFGDHFKTQSAWTTKTDFPWMTSINVR